MHRFSVPRPTLWKFWILLLLYGGISCTPVAAQDLKAIVVPINVTKSIPAPPGKIVTDIRFDKKDIARGNPSRDGQSALITGLATGTTTVTILDQNNMIIEKLEVIVQTDVEYLKYMLRQVVPTANVVPIPSVNNTFILTGTVIKGDDIARLLATAQSVVGGNIINAMTVGGVQQVQLDVVIAQVVRSEIRELSFQFQNTGQRHFLASTLGSPATASVSQSNSVAGAAAALTGSSNLLLGFLNDKQGFFGYLQALRTENLAKFHSEPRLVTTSGKSAGIHIGGDLAVPEPSGLGTNAVTFRQFGTTLNFLPIVLGNGKIAIEIDQKVSARNDANGTTISGTTVPGFDSQNIHTSVELEPGQTFAIGGLVENTYGAGASKVPILGDIPYLNVFFSGKSANQKETELIIIVTPHLVDPMACNQLPKYLPGQETRIVDDFELFFEGILEAPRGPRRIRGDDHHYKAAHRYGPSMEVYPCYGFGSLVGGNSSIGGAGCQNGACGVTTSLYQNASSGNPAPKTVTGQLQPLPQAPIYTQPVPLPVQQGVDSTPAVPQAIEIPSAPRVPVMPMPAAPISMPASGAVTMPAMTTPVVPVTNMVPTATPVPLLPRR